MLLGISLVTLSFIGTYILSSYFSLSEHFVIWAKQYEEVAEIDEFPIALLASLFAMIWFSVQRIAESNDLIKKNHMLLHRILEIQEDERKSIAINLHDDLGQYLSAIKAEAKSLIISSDVTTDIADTAKRISINAEHAYKSTRLMMRDLRPVALDELGLHAAIEQLVDQWNLAKQKNITYELSVDGNINNFHGHMNIAIFRIIQEALTNIVKHADATKVHILLLRNNNDLSIKLTDNGIGFEPINIQKGCGLLGMYERAESLNSSLTITSTLGQGTEIHLTIPI